MKISLEIKKEDMWFGLFFRKDSPQIAPVPPLAESKFVDHIPFFSSKVMFSNTIHIWICLIPCFPIHVRYTINYGMHAPCKGQDLGEKVYRGPGRYFKPIIDCKELPTAVVAETPFCNRHKIAFEKRQEEFRKPGH